tara:strand:+ start:62 stop:736 length:675 start_codon:yes stop_codon:yes gene_type:complete
MANQLNEGGKPRAQELMSSLKVGQTLLTKVIKTSNPNYVRMELVERIAKPNNKSTDDGILSMYEMSFGSNSSLQYFWQPVDIDNLQAWLDIAELDITLAEFTTEVDSKGKAREVYYLNVPQPTAFVNPVTGEAIEARMHGRIIETTEGQDWQIENGDHKINPSTKEAVTHNENYVYFNNKIVFTADVSDNAKIPHVYLANDVKSITTKVESTEEVLDEVNLDMM